ncbi:unnamed protein product [Calicophoron daubneyi]|uniref:GOLD domain-containing protein n=1 Tax=Calicophoron daubneyi TaxID=300641 RepID=A0AAV2TQ12_CALDB
MFSTFAWSALVVLSLLQSGLAVRFHLKPGEKRCLQHDSPKGVITNGIYEVGESSSHITNISVRDSKQHLLYKRDSIDKGTYAFTTEDYEVVAVCFETKMQANAPPVDREVFLDVKQGAEAKNYDLLAKAEKLKPMEAELKRLEALTDEIVRDFNAMHTKSTNMRATNESTHTRVLYFSVLSMIILVGFACWQVLYLRRYFKSKKLIE